MNRKEKDLVVRTDNTTSKNFRYAKGNVSLSFVLRTDIKTELKDFVKCLETALKDVKDELEK